MVTRILQFAVDLTSDQTDISAGSQSPRDGQRWDVQELYATQEADVDMSLVLNERKLFDNVTSTDIPDPDNGLPVDITVDQGDDIDVLMSETGSTDPAEQTLYLVVDETGSSGP